MRIKLNSINRTRQASQRSLLTTKYNPAMNAMDIITSATPRRGNANLTESRIRPTSVNCAQMNMAATVELCIATVLQITNKWNIFSISMIAKPWSGPELLSPPGIVNPS
ncbi:hypothetical protein SLEP1_g36867 [Rubroshorea leprosula]|uniref:Uncharacterized protein n=1 Tax=Rubroshorea leprosula TaxID=152421 RepID=A0AAV5KSW7_9ROSI|nr:hypothetical protein SLEP1_g36867 [Rubroshorea leprosula]